MTYLTAESARLLVERTRGEYPADGVMGSTHELSSEAAVSKLSERLSYFFCPFYRRINNVYNEINRRVNNKRD